jgi:hypothetical protein
MWFIFRIIKFFELFKKVFVWGLVVWICLGVVNIFRESRLSFVEYLTGGLSIGIICTIIFIVATFILGSMQNEKAFQAKDEDQEGGTPYTIVDGVPVVSAEVTVLDGVVVEIENPLLMPANQQVLPRKWLTMWKPRFWQRGGSINNIDFIHCQRCGSDCYATAVPGGKICTNCQNFSPNHKKRQ